MNQFLQNEREIQVLRENAEILSAVASAPERHHCNLTADEIKILTDKLLVSAAVDVQKWWNDTHEAGKHVSAPTLSRYKTHFKTHGTYATPAKRGPKELVTETELARMKLITQEARTLGYQLTAAKFAMIARGVVKAMRPHDDVEPVPHLHRFSETWARETLKKLDQKCVKGAADRVVELGEVIESGRAFFDKLAAERDTYDPRLVFNVNEFFVTLGENHQWTWERIIDGTKDNVVIDRNLIGFTCSALTSMDGTFHLLQMIWRGLTEESEAAVEPDKLNSKILQQHREGSYFQNADTWKEYIAKFSSIIAPLRQAVMEEKHMNELPPVLFIIDQAPQHGETDGFPQWLRFALIPKKMTHIFQPADQYIIACLKKQSNTFYLKQIEDVVKKYCAEPQRCARILIGAEIPPTENGDTAFFCKANFKRDNKYLALSHSINNLSPATIIQSWARTGIPRAFGLPQPYDSNGNLVPVLFDKYEKNHKELMLLHASGQVDEGSESAAHGAEVESGSAALIPDAPVPAEARRTPAPTTVAKAPNAAPKKSVGRPKASQLPLKGKYRDIREMFAAKTQRPHGNAEEELPAQRERFEAVDERN